MTRSEQARVCGVRLQPNDDRVHFNLGNLLAASGRAGEAERELRRAVEINPDNGDAHFNLGVLMGARGNAAPVRCRICAVRWRCAAMPTRITILDWRWRFQESWTKGYRGA